MKKSWTLWALVILLGIGSGITVGQAAPQTTDGCQVYLGAEQAAQVKNGELKLTWSGVCQKGFAEGDGILILQKGKEEVRRYEGPMTLGRAQGKGLSKVAGVGTYKGDFVDDLAQGIGQFTLENGNSYTGEWVGGEPKGKGVFRWANGDVYDGTWDNFTYQGRGVYTWANGNRYEGEWKDGKRSGQGTYIRTNGSRYDGKWMEDRYFDSGIYVDATGNRTDWKMAEKPTPDFGPLDVAQSPAEGDETLHSEAKSTYERVINRVRHEVYEHFGNKLRVRTPSAVTSVRG